MRLRLLRVNKPVSPYSNAQPGFRGKITLVPILPIGAKCDCDYYGSKNPSIT